MSTEQQAQETQAGSEFEREPVPQNRLLGFRSFVGMYAGEHTAGTELMIGPLFVAAGVSAYDVVVGLLVGNLLAVLSWVFMCAPIATRCALTLYYQLEKICGRKLVTLYDLANGVMFCFLAGAMVTVSATALGVWFHFQMPALNDLYPNSVGWVIAVLVSGAMIAVVAAYGYEIVAKVGEIAAPWMVLVFIAFGLVGLRQFIDATGDPGREPVRCLDAGQYADLQRRRPAAGPNQVHLLARDVLRLVLQHGDAHRDVRSVRPAFREEILVRAWPAGPACSSGTIWPGWRRRSSTRSNCIRTRATRRCCPARSPTRRPA